ncbi:hypothetical protein SUGI_0347520 [Cryptomeria japonica]|nr:hypothetical protein SUGI_0347520 [Cryptomeria japonica]
MIWSVFKKNPDQPLFLYVDNGLKMTDIRQLLPEDLGNCLPPRSRLLVTTRNLQETNIFVFWNVQRQQYLVNPLPDTDARKILLKRASDHNDEQHIHDLLKLCGGIPLLLELAGAQLAISTTYANMMVLELLKAGEKVQDISDCMVDFVSNRLLEPVKETFLDITCFFYTGPNIRRPQEHSIGEEEFRALEEASLIKRSEDGFMTIHDIIQARGKKMSEQNRITDSETLLDCLNNEERLKNLEGIYFRGEREQPPIEINADHLKCMSDSLRVLLYSGSSAIQFRGKCHKPFKELRCLWIACKISDLPTEFVKLERLAFYLGPFTQAMSLYELPPCLRVMHITFHVKKGVADSKISPRVTSASSLVQLTCWSLANMQMLPEGLENLTKLEKLVLYGCYQLRELPSKFGELINLKDLSLWDCNELKELPSEFGQLNNLKRLVLSECPQLKELSSDFGRLSNLTELQLGGCSTLGVLPSSFGQLSNLKDMYFNDCSSLSVLPPSFGQFNNLINLALKGCSALTLLPSGFGQLKSLEDIQLNHCSGLKDLPSDFGQLQNLKRLNLSHCSGLKELPAGFGQLKSLKKLELSHCSGLKELPAGFGQLKSLKELELSHCSGLKELPAGFGQLKSLEELELSQCSGLKELPFDFGQLKNLTKLDLSHCSGLEEWPLSFKDLTGIKNINLTGCQKLKESLPNNISGNCST